LHADAMTIVNKDGREVALKQSQIISAEQMFKDTIGELEKKGKSFKYFKSHLNIETLMIANSYRPKILIINCHGEIDKETKKTYFCFENRDRPSVID